jgi:hypothetical protein
MAQVAEHLPSKQFKTPVLPKKISFKCLTHFFRKKLLFNNQLREQANLEKDLRESSGLSPWIYQ